MKYGKIRIEDGNLIFTKRVKTNTLPCSEILWAYRRKEEPTGKNTGGGHALCLVTRLRKKYKFEMTLEEAASCLRELQRLNPRIAVGYPKGARIAFQSLANTRDLGALKATDGRVILPHRLLRSGDLYHLSNEDQRVLLEEYHLTKVIDFRTEKEQERRPDTVLKGVTYVQNPILDEETMGITRERRLLDEVVDSKIDMGEFLEKVYQNLVLEPYAVDRYAKFFDELLHQDDGAVLYHCSAGKDRVGIGTVLLLSALGIPRPVIVEDYLRTNEYLESEAEYLVRLLETKMVVSPQTYSNIQALYSVRKIYLETVFQVIDKGLIPWKIISGRKCICLQECWNSFEIGIWCEKLLFFEGLRLIYVESAIDKPELVGIIKKIYKVVGNNRTRVIVSINPRNLGERRDIHEGK